MIIRRKTLDFARKMINQQKLWYYVVCVCVVGKKGRNERKVLVFPFSSGFSAPALVYVNCAGARRDDIKD
jgi:hypothetical protein